MSTDLAIASPQAVPAAYVPPAMSDGLMKAISDMTDPHTDIGPPATLPARVKGEAIAVGDVHRHACQPVSPDRMRAWVMPIIASAFVSQGKTRSEEELEIWLSALHLAVGHLEVGAFTIESQMEALASIRFFPFPADIYAVIAPRAVRLRDLFSVLKRIILTPTTAAGAA